MIGLIVAGAVVLVAVVAVVLIYVGVKATQLDANTAWRDFTPPGESFVVAFPGTPVQKDPTTYELTFRLQRITFGVTFKDVPALNPGQQEAAFNGARDAIVRAIAGGTLVNDKRISFGPYPGREWEVHGAANRYAFARAYAVHQRFYILAVDGPQAESLTAHARKFVDSFKLPGNQAPGNTAPGGGDEDGVQPAVVLSNVRISSDAFFPKVALDYQFERGAPGSDMVFHLVVTAANGKSYDQLLIVTEAKAKLNQEMLPLPKTERGPFKVHLEIVRVKANAKPVKVSNVVSVNW